MGEPNPLTELSLAELRARRSEKWRRYPPDVLPLWVAEMDTPLAPPIRQALAEAIAAGDTGYEHPGGLPEAFAGFADRRWGWAPEPSSMFVVPDVMHGVTTVLRRLTADGDGVVINPPVYPPFFAFLGLAGRRVVTSPLATDGYGRHRLDLDRLAHDLARPEVTAYLLCNPHNPTGIVLGRDELLAVAELAVRHRVRVLVDEIHAPLTYPGRPFVPYLSLVDEVPEVAEAVVFASASKAWNLPGLKAALVIAGSRVRPQLAELPAEAYFGAGLLGVIASEVAFSDCDGWLDALITGLDDNRRRLGELLAGGLPAIRYQPPEATYLAWLDCRGLGLAGDPALVFQRHGRVAVNPGPSFGVPGAGYVRLNFATSPAVLTEAVRRMAGAVVLSRRSGG